MRSISIQVMFTCALSVGITAARSQQLVVKSDTAEWRAWVGQGHAIFVGDVWEPMETKVNFRDWSTSQPSIFVELDLGSTKDDIPDGTYLYMYTGNPENGSNIYLGRRDFPPYSGYSIRDEWEVIDWQLLPKGETEAKWYMTDMWWYGTLGIAWWTVTPTDPDWIPINMELILFS
ncbi:unnamed protein product [Clonostachys rosea]|uniref:Uncharacterized protein n=1 Tax=Bionectria ochroleuca TaxID=29856 RepID=A0ABY6V1G5_BIOOC|nr:unnamed protein product [Clonostachys rosea]